LITVLSVIVQRINLGVRRGFYQAGFDDAIARYAPGISAASVTDATEVTGSNLPEYSQAGSTDCMAGTATVQQLRTLVYRYSTLLTGHYVTAVGKIVRGLISRTLGTNGGA